MFNKPAPEPVVSKRAPKEVEEIDTLELARQISLMMFAAFSRVQAHELLGNSFSSKHKQTLAPNIVKLTDQFNDFSRWVMYNVVTQMDLKKRAALVRKFVLMAEELRRLNNLNGVFAIVAGLSGAPVHRLKRTWEIVLKDKKTSEWWEYQLDLTNPQSRLAAERGVRASQLTKAAQFWQVSRRQSALRATGSAVLGSLFARFGRARAAGARVTHAIVADLTFIEEGNNDKLENGYINFVKFRMIAGAPPPGPRTSLTYLPVDIVSEIQTFQLRQYNLRDVPSIQNYLLMTRILDEEKLFALSLTVEPSEFFVLLAFVRSTSCRGAEKVIKQSLYITKRFICVAAAGITTRDSGLCWPLYLQPNVKPGRACTRQQRTAAVVAHTASTHATTTIAFVSVATVCAAEKQCVRRNIYRS